MSDAATPTLDSPEAIDAPITLIKVVTGGGGAPTAAKDGSASSGSNSFGGNPFGSGSSSGSSSTGTASSGSSSGDISDDGPSDDSSADSSSGEMAETGPTPDSSSGSSSGSTTDSGGADSGPSGAPDASEAGMSTMPDASTNACTPYKAPLCGTTACDLRSHTCCISQSTLQATCISGAYQTCPSAEDATFQCTQACDCPSGKVCCGVDNTLLQVYQTVCQDVSNTKGLCQPNPANSTQASAQFCKVNSECKNGQPCVSQTCYEVPVQLCGLQSAAPFNCTMNGAAGH